MNALLQEAEQFVSQGRLTDAELAFARAVEAGRSPEALIKFADFLVSNGRLSEARDTYKEATRLPEAFAEDVKAAAFRGLGHIAWMRREFEDAEKMFRRALQADERLNRRHDQAADCRGIGGALMSRGEFDYAKGLFERALNI